MSSPDSRKRERSNSPPERSSREKSSKSSRFAPAPSSTSTSSTTINASIPANSSTAKVDITAASSAAAEIQRQIAAQIASVSNLLNAAKSGTTNTGGSTTTAATEKKKVAFRPLLLDDQGREIDEHGNIIKTDAQQLKTLAANVAVAHAQKKKENPYLSHRTASATTALEDELIPSSFQDPRLAHLSAPRSSKAKKSFQFIEAGTYVKEENKIRAKEERKVIGGYSSGRRAPEIVDLNIGKGQKTILKDKENCNLSETSSTSSDDAENETVGGEKGERKGKMSASATLVPLHSDDGELLPNTYIEWWDELYLPKEIQDIRKKSKAAILIDHFDLLDLTNHKTFKYIQHPIPVKPLGGEMIEKPLPMFLTKKERKRIRKASREIKEQEKRDKMMMGLLPPPEPKFKLSNFMKILGDQAVADPSKVEQRVVQQIQKRLLDHEMRNLSAKLTSTQRAEKQRKKLLEDTSRQVHVAIFRVRNFNDRKHRFKVDVNAQQFNMSGIVLLCADGGYTLPSGAVSGSNLVVLEGGPKGIRKMIHLMLNRIAWDVMQEPEIESNTNYDQQQHENSNVLDNNNNSSSEHPENMLISSKGEENDHDNDNDDEEEEEEEEDKLVSATESRSNNNTTNMHEELPTATSAGSEPILSKDNRCDLLWKGVLPKRTFQGFKFQECKTASTARKLLESKGVAHYWDMAYRADDMLEVTQF